MNKKINIDNDIEIESNSDDKYLTLEHNDSFQETIPLSTDNSLLFSENSVNPINDTNVLEKQPINFERPIIDWKDEALKGNFMPATVLLDRKSIRVDQVVDPMTENRLIHCASIYSYLNVVRTLVEIFNSNINEKNNIGQTPLHIVCNNQYQDAYLLSYFIKQDFLLPFEVDKSGVTPIFYAVMNNFNIAIMALAHLKADLTHVDNYGNNLFYFALTSNNKFAMNFFMEHKPLFNINKLYYNKSATLADVLITNKNVSCAKHLIKYYHNDLNINSIISCRKEINSFNVYNKFNYDMLNTLYFFKTKDYLGFIKAIFNKQSKEVNSHSYSFKVYNIYLLIHMLLCNLGRFFKFIFIWAYIIKLSGFYLLMFILVNYNKNVISDFSFKDYFLAIWPLISILLAIFTLIKFSICNTYDKFYEENKYSLTNCEYARENVCGQIYEAMERNPIDLFFEEEICEICLIKKSKDANHCHLCKKCVKDFYFHSKILDTCFNKDNINLYIKFLFSIFLICLANFLILFSFVDVEYKETNNSSIMTIYESEYILTNIYIFLTHAGNFKLIFSSILLIKCVIFFQKLMTPLICLGYKTTYYNMFRMHKRSVGEIQQRTNLYYNIPKMNLISLTGLLKNLIYNKKSD